MLGLIFFFACNDILVILRCNLNEKKIYLSGQFEKNKWTM